MKEILTAIKVLCCAQRTGCSMMDFGRIGFPLDFRRVHLEMHLDQIHESARLPSWMFDFYEECCRPNVLVLIRSSTSQSYPSPNSRPFSKHVSYRLRAAGDFFKYETEAIEIFARYTSKHCLGDIWC